ncbi:sigma 54-interacting transcriptional regulator [Peribacillus frigoritolerans]|uniref:sigma 54-interacting transcriptional regulator n=1 Tax=Peribacillus frigoritolerans TaxID=450367 RepID=UPI003826E047
MPLLKEIMTPVNECLFPENTLYQAVEFMGKSKWNTVPVTDSFGKLIGIFTRNILYQMVLDGHELTTPIANFIKEDVRTVPEDRSFEEVEKTLMNIKVGTGIIINEIGHPIGLVTKDDAVMTLLEKTHLLKEQLETILHTSHLGAAMTDENKQIVFMNDRFREMMGQSEDDLLKQELNRVIPDLRTETEKEKEIQQRVRIRSEHFILRLSKYTMAGGQQGYIALFQDVSELENMAQELETVKELKTILQTVIHNTYDGLVMINEKNNIEFISPSLLELFDLHEKEIDEAPIPSVLPHLGLTHVLKTGVADISDFMEVKGINYIVHRIPVYQEGRIIGAIGKIVFRQLHEVRERFRRYEISEKQIQNRPKKSDVSRFTFEQILSADPQMEKIMRSGMKAAKGRSTILIRGESGTGKELFVHALHGMSSRGEGPFITVNCAAIPEHLLESEFFGYEDGAFTGAKHKGKIGKFDLAHGGTLFLDEVGDMSFQLQAKLLRVLQEREYYRVGGTERIQVDVRIIAATHRSLEEMVENGTFREDLFYRLNVISFEIPPLRRRKKDILMLSESFIRELNKLNGTSITGWEPMVQQVLMDYDWPGNIRELRNVWERAMVFAEHGKIQLGDLPDYLLKKVGYDVMLEEDEEQDLSLLEKAEQAALHIAMQVANGNKSKAAELLGISRSVLYNKLRKYDVVDFK